jgi:hypothetical protein
VYSWGYYRHFSAVTGDEAARINNVEPNDKERNNLLMHNLKVAIVGWRYMFRPFQSEHVEVVYRKYKNKIVSFISLFVVHSLTMVTSKKCNVCHCHFLSKSFTPYHINVHTWSVFITVTYVRFLRNPSYFSIVWLNCSIHTWRTIHEVQTYKECTLEFCLYNYFLLQILVSVSVLR